MKRWDLVGCAALFGLSVLQVAWNALDPTRASALATVLAAFLPLYPAVAMVLRPPSARRALLVGGMFALFYFAHGVMEAWADSELRPIALIEVALATSIVLALGMATSAEKRAARKPK